MTNLRNVPINEYEIATFALGACWKVEAVFRNKVNGIIGTAIGYIGDEVKYPRLESRTENKNDLVQAVQILFDPKTVTYDRLLELFWELHDPSYALKSDDQKEQFKSIIYYHSEKQREKAIISKKRFERSEKFKGNFITQILPATHFFKVEKEAVKSSNNNDKKMNINKKFPLKRIQHQAR